RAQVALSLEGMILEHERDYRGTRLEWPALADVSHCALTALELLTGVVSGLRIHTDRMRERTEQRAEAAGTEAMMLALGTFGGKQRAFEVVHALSQSAQDRKVPLLTMAKQAPEIVSLIGESALEGIFVPSAHLGASGALVDRVLAELERAVAGHLRATPVAP